MQPRADLIKILSHDIQRVQPIPIFLRDGLFFAYFGYTRGYMKKIFEISKHFLRKSPCISTICVLI